MKTNKNLHDWSANARRTEVGGSFIPALTAKSNTILHISQLWSDFKPAYLLLRLRTLCINTHSLPHTVGARFQLVLLYHLQGTYRYWIMCKEHVRIFPSAYQYSDLRYEQRSAYAGYRSCHWWQVDHYRDIDVPMIQDDIRHSETYLILTPCGTEESVLISEVSWFRRCNRVFGTAQISPVNWGVLISVRIINIAT